MGQIMKAQLKSSYLLLALFVALALGCSDDGKNTAASVERHLLQSNTYLQQGQFRAAQIEAKNAIQKAPDNIAGHIALARISNAMGRYKYAIARLERLPEQAYQDTNFLQTLAQAYIKRNKFRSARALLENSQSVLRPLGQSYLLLLAQAENGLGNSFIAKALYQQVLSADPNNVEALLAMARMKTSESNIAEANRLIDQSLAVANDNPDAYFLQAQISLAADNWEAAENQLTEALSLLPNVDVMTPRKSVYLALLTDLLVQQGKSAEALIYTQQIARAFPGMEVAQGEFRDASSLFEQGEFEQAENKLRKLVDEYPNFEEAALLLAVIRYRAGDTEAASNYFSGRVDAEISDPRITKLAAIADLRNNQPERVISLLEKYVSDNEDAQLLVIFGKAAIAANQRAEAERALKRAIIINPTIDEPYLSLADMYNSATPPDREEALYILRNGSESNPANFILAASLARQLVLLNRANDAQAIIDQQLQANRDDPALLELAGDFHYSQLQLDSASEYYRKALQADSKHFASAMKLALIASQSNAFDRTIEAFKVANRIAPDNPLPLEGMLESARSDKQWDSAEATLLEINATQSSGIGYAVLAMAYANRDLLDKAEPYQRQLLEQAPDSALLPATSRAIHYAKGRSHLLGNDLIAARQETLAGLAIDANATALLTLLSNIEIEAGNFSEAKKVVDQIANSNPLLAGELRGDLYLAQQNFAAAIQSYLDVWQARANDTLATKLYSLLSDSDATQAAKFLDDWLLQFPDSVRAMGARATTYLVQGDFNTAIPLMETIRTRAPKYALNLNNLAWAYQQVNNPAALQTAAQAYKLAPNTASIADTYGWILFGDGQYDTAVDILSTAVELAPEDAEIRGHLEQAKLEQAQ